MTAMAYRRILIYPSWASFRFKWNQLSNTIADHARWGLSNIEDYTRLGYWVEEGDQDVIDGPGAGGLICVRRDLGRWLPSALFHTEASFEPIPGFSKAALFPIYFLVGRITPEHKLGFAPYPSAPSPIFSLERTEGPLEIPHIGMAATDEHSFGVLRDRIQFWKSQPKVQSTPPQECAERFEAILRPGFKYLWFTIPFQSSELLLDLAKYAHASSFANRQNMSLASFVHFFVSRREPLEGEFSALRWQRRTRLRRTANDW